MGKAFRFPVEADRLAAQFGGAMSERERAELGLLLAERDRNLEDYVSAAVRRFDVDAKGDLLVATASDRIDRLAVGANDLVLSADSAAPTGVAWKRPVMPGCVLTRTTNQLIAEAIEVAVAFDSALWDPYAMRSGASIVIPETGLWLVNAGAYWAQYNAGFGVGGQRSIHVVRNRGGTLTNIIDEHVSAGSPDSVAPPNSNPSMVGPGHYPSRPCPLNAGDILTMEVLQQKFPGQPVGDRALVATTHNPTLSAVLASR